MNSYCHTNSFPTISSTCLEINDHNEHARKRRDGISRTNDSVSPCLSLFCFFLIGLACSVPWRVSRRVRVLVGCLHTYVCLATCVGYACLAQIHVFTGVRRWNRSFLFVFTFFLTWLVGRMSHRIIYPSPGCTVHM